MSPFVGERVINHSKDVLEETYDLWDYFDEKRDALERLENYLLGSETTNAADPAGQTGQSPKLVDAPGAARRRFATRRPSR